VRRLLVASVSLAALVACVGKIGDGESPPDPGTTPAADDLSIGPSPLRRLSRAEYNNAVRDLFHGALTPADDWPADGQDSGFDNDINGQGATADLVEQMMRSAETIAVDALTRIGTLLPCAATSTDDKACGQQFIEQYGKRAFRRPLTDEDRTRLTKVLQYGLDHGGLNDGIRLVITAMLQSSSFLYRPEAGAQDGVVELSHYEIATRLSFMLTNSTPDDALLAAADAGKLHDPEELRTQAERLLASPAGRRALDHFFSQWFPFDRLSRTVKSPTVYPEFDTAMRDGMAAGARAFIQYVVYDSERGDVSELLSANYTFVNEKTAPLYGITATGSALVRKTLAEPRSGLLTEAGMMAALSDNYQSSPVARGKFVYRDLLCQDVPPPPADLPAAGVPPPPDPSKTTRERFDEHRRNKVCAGCHQFMDPLGFALENYDAIGRYRADENGKPIDATGNVKIEGENVTFDGPGQLSKYIAGSPLLRDCFSKKWFTYAFGRTSATEDEATLRNLGKQFGDGTLRIRDFLISTTQLYAFTHRKGQAPAEACTP
jgi:hypothetical protein